MKRTQKKHQRIDIVIVIGLTLFSLFMWWPTRNLPYHWDGAGFFVNAARTLQSSNFQPLIASFSDFAHPPLLQIVTAIMWRLFSDSRVVTHLIMFPFMPLLLVSTYLIGSSLTKSKTTGLLAALAVGCTPFVRAEYALTYIDLPAGALTVAGYAALIYRKHPLAAICFAAAILVKFTIFPILVVIAFTSFIKRKPAIPMYVWLVPTLLAFGYFLYHHAVTGWWMVIPGRPTVMPNTFQTIFNSFKFVGYAFFIRQFRWIFLAITALLGLMKIKKLKHNQTLKVTFSLLIIICVGLSSFAISGEFVPRYAMYLLPLWYVFGFTVIKLSVSRNYELLLGLIIIFSFTQSWIPKEPPTTAYEFRNNEDGSYIDHINVGVDSAHWLETHYRGAHIYGGFPQNYQLTQPYQGYVTLPFKFSSCDEFSPSDEIQLIYFYPYSYTAIPCETIIRQYPSTPVYKSMSGRIWATIHQIKTTNQLDLKQK